MIPSMLHSRPFAFSSWAGCTMLGMIVCAELSRSTSAMPSSSVASSTSRNRPVRVPVTDSSSSGPGSECCWPSTANATNNVRNARSVSIAIIALRRSTRSVITPAGNVNTSQGRRCATMHQCDQDRVAGDGGCQPRVGDDRHAVAEVGDDARPEELVIAESESFRCGGLRRLARIGIGLRSRRVTPLRAGRSGDWWGTRPRTCRTRRRRRAARR